MIFEVIQEIFSVAIKPRISYSWLWKYC